MGEEKKRKNEEEKEEIQSNKQTKKQNTEEEERARGTPRGDKNQEDIGGQIVGTKTKSKYIVEPIHTKRKKTTKA